VNLSNKGIFLFVLSVGAVLRFWDYTSIPFTHDEFSAFFRTRFTSFSQLIEYGVRPDGHPAGVQVFLYYWIQLFGASEWVVKLPFALAGLASIYLLWRIALCWYNSTVALVCAAFLATLQYTVFYSVIARPYISGLFLGLAMVYFWTKLVQHPKRNFWLNGVLFSLFAALCAYNHHFSLLFAAVVGVSGLFYIKAEFRLKYISLALLIVLLYAPHFPIFFYQLSNKGVEGWLAKPDLSFLVNYAGYIFHFSWFMLALVLILMGYGAVKRDKQAKLKKFVLFASWFVLPLIIGYVYSVHVNAVLQFSVLIFSFPYLLFMLFGHLPELKPRTNLLLVTVIMAVSTITLATTRQHFKLLRESHYENIVTNTGVARRIGVTTNLVHTHHKISDYYIAKNHSPADHIYVDTFSTQGSFRRYVASLASTEPGIYWGAWSSANPNFKSIIADYFPTKWWSRDYVGGTTSIYTKEQKKETKDIARIEEIFSLDTTQEWGPSLLINMGEVLQHKNDELVLHLQVANSQNLEDISLVAVVERDGEVLHWSDIKVSSCIADTGADWHTVYHTLTLANIPHSEGATLKTFIWNSGKRQATFRDFGVRYQHGNRVVYGLTDGY
jgi:hypothetical protein